jgi:hypothetical protein
MKQKMYPLLILIAALALIMIGCDAPQEELPEIPEVTEYPSVNPVNNLSMFEQTSEGAMERTGDRLDMGEEIVFLDEVIEVDNIPLRQGPNRRFRGRIRFRLLYLRRRRFGSNHR